MIATVAPFVPPVVHTPVVREEKVTGLVEPPPVAETVKGASPKVLPASAPKPIDWLAKVTKRRRDCCGAAK